MSLGRSELFHDPCPPGLRITALEFGVVKCCVDVHLRAFPNFFLSSLGPKFLEEFYRSFVTDPDGIGFVAADRPVTVVGVVVGALNPGGYFWRLLMRRWWAFCLASLTRLTRQPSIARRLLRALVYRGQSPPGPPRALLSSLAVAPEYQGRGIGRQLVEQWLKEVRRRGAVGCYLTTDAEGNDRVNAFYSQLGWRREATYCSPEGRRMNRYVLDF